MKIKIALLSSLFIILSCCTAFAECDKGADIFDCLENKILKKDISGIKYEVELWDVYQKAEKKAMQCSPLKDTAKFFELGTLPFGVGLQEYFAESLEKIFLKDSKCYFDAVLLLDKKLRPEVIQYIALPVYTEDQDMLDKMVLKFKGTMKYDELVDLYFEITKQVKRLNRNSTE